MNQTLHCASRPVHPVHLVTKKKFVIFVLSVGKTKNNQVYLVRLVIKKNQCNLCNPLTKTKKPCYPHGRQSLAKVNLQLIYSLKPLYVVCVVCCLHIVFAQVVGCAQLVVDYVLYNHILAVELLDDDIAVLRVWMHAADGIVRNPNRIVAILSINHKIPRASLALICNRFQLGVDKRANLVDDSLGKLHPCFSV